MLFVPGRGSSMVLVVNIVSPCGITSYMDVYACVYVYVSTYLLHTVLGKKSNNMIT